MRAAPAVIVALALCVTPVVAQSKTKAATTPFGVQVLEICEAFASGDAQALQTATDNGWDAYDQGAESPFVKSYSGSKEIVGFGYANLFSLVESYPETTFGYCRVDVSEVRPTASMQVQAIHDLDRYEGEIVSNDDGTFASLTGTTEKNRLLLTHYGEEVFVIQLSIITPKAEAAE